MLEETGFDVAGRVFPLDVNSAYALRPELASRWEEIYGHGIHHVSVIAFGAEAPDGDPVLDPQEHDALAWCSYAEADALLDWPIEGDALDARRQALSVLNARLQSHE